MRIFGLFIFIPLFVSSFARGQKTAYHRQCTAIVQGQTAEFIFPLPIKQTWTWNMKETKDNSQEYTWEIALTGPDSKSTYNFGIYLFKYPKSQEVTGGIQKLISAAQTSVLDKQLKFREDLIVQSTVQGQKLILKVSDKKTFSELFSQKPTIAHCRVITPYKDINYASQTEIYFNK